MNQLVSLIYVSSSKGLFNETDLVELLRSARIANKKHEITGMLLYHEGNIMQVLEGNEKDVNQLFSNILKDARHHGVIKMICEPILKRDFSDWRMSYLNISKIHVDGFSNFLVAKKSDRKNDALVSKAKKILYKFREQLKHTYEA